LLSGLAGVAIFALTLPATRLVIEDLNPFFIGLGRAVVAGLFALLILIFTRSALPTPRQFKLLMLTAAGVVIGFPVFSAIAMQSVDASHGGIVLALLPLATAFAAIWVSHERPSPGFWIVGISGSLLVTVFALIQGSGRFQPGDFALFAATLCAAFSYAIGGKLSREMAGWQVICWSLVIALPFILIPALLTAPAEPFNLSGKTWLGFLYLALFSQLIGFFLWNKGLALGGIARVSQVQLLQPFITLAAAALLLNESIGWLSIGFCILVVINVAIGKRMPILHSHGR
jgi:drug/metabolite transporter (DMT)-like permease